MAEERRLIQDGSNSIYVWTEALAKRKDMRLYNPKSAERTGIEIRPANEKTVPIELQGKTFLVEPDLHAVLLEMGGVMVGLQEENEALKKAAEDFEALKERLTTDNLDLTEQLAKAKTDLAAANTPETSEAAGTEGEAAESKKPTRKSAGKAQAVGTEG